MDSSKKEISELRQDPISGDWIIISTGRAKRPESFKSHNIAALETPINLCPFENPQEHGNVIIKTYGGNDHNWTVKVVKNKFPIVSGQNCGFEKRIGPYISNEAAGHHEVIIFKDHRKSLAQLETTDVGRIVDVFKERYLELEKMPCANYILIMLNHGRKAGASVSHPHAQILALPFVPSDIRRSLEGSKRYYDERGRCAHCDILSWEFKEKKRIVFENDFFVALVPYAPKFSYEIRIFPKKHNSYFEETEDVELKDFAEILRVALAKIYNGLNNPSYNFFIHTPPAERDHNHEYDYYHWHLEINPRLAIWGGFELGTGGDVIDVDPDEAAEFLRNIKV